DPARVLSHVRALNRWYATDERVTITPQYVSKLMVDAGDPRSEFWDLMRNETVPSDSLFSNRMQAMTLAVVGQLNATANWHRIMSEWIFGAPPCSPLGLAEAEFFGARPAPILRAA
ncbi:MAG TPA: AarF/ABC1/UbiB kinase family protein, partial [Solirubrobacteraceae bacterium]|nr:AarF/ABC1/UbiB kinase family protein [Solirubrobacteraceae bacterium]